MTCHRHTTTCCGRRGEGVSTAIEVLESKLNETIGALVDMVNQHCSEEGDEWNTMALSANAHAVDVLASLGRVEIIRECGRMIVFKWKVRP